MRCRAFGHDFISADPRGAVKGRDALTFLLDGEAIEQSGVRLKFKGNSSCADLHQGDPRQLSDKQCGANSCRWLLGVHSLRTSILALALISLSSRLPKERGITHSDPKDQRYRQ